MQVHLDKLSDEIEESENWIEEKENLERMNYK